VPSSISNSKFPPVPSGRWVRPWLIAVAVILALLAALEGGLRLAGREPSAKDGKALWAYWRQQCNESSSNAVVLLGNSRVRVGFSPEGWRQEFPGATTIQLGIVVSSPVPALQDLANDPKFRETVICELSAMEIIPSALWLPQKDSISWFHKEWCPSRRIDCLLHLAIEQNLVVANPRLNLKQILSGDPAEAVHQPNGVRVRSDRTIEVKHAEGGVWGSREPLLEMPLEQAGTVQLIKPQEWSDAVNCIAEATRSICTRGGRVVFVHFPVSGRLRVAEEAFFPKSVYWDGFAKAVGAPAIHFEDVPALRDFSCPDGSHLSSADAPTFTRALSQELVRRGILKPGSGSTPH